MFASGHLVFTSDFSQASISLISGLLEKDKRYRKGAQSKGGIEAIKSSSFFSGVDFDQLRAHQIKAPYVPNLATEVDSVHFD
jgi:hypothetical protein